MQPHPPDEKLNFLLQCISKILHLSWEISYFLQKYRVQFLVPFPAPVLKFLRIGAGKSTGNSALYCMSGNLAFLPARARARSLPIQPIFTIPGHTNPSCTRGRRRLTIWTQHSSLSCRYTSPCTYEIIVPLTGALVVTLHACTWSIHKMQPHQHMNLILDPL